METTILPTFTAYTAGANGWQAELAIAARVFNQIATTEANTGRAGLLAYNYLVGHGVTETSPITKPWPTDKANLAVTALTYAYLIAQQQP